MRARRWRQWERQLRGVGCWAVFFAMVAFYLPVVTAIQALLQARVLVMLLHAKGPAGMGVGCACYLSDVICAAETLEHACAARPHHRCARAALDLCTARRGTPHRRLPAAGVLWLPCPSNPARQLDSLCQCYEHALVPRWDSEHVSGACAGPEC